MREAEADVLNPSNIGARIAAIEGRAVRRSKRRRIVDGVRRDAIAAEDRVLFVWVVVNLRVVLRHRVGCYGRTDVVIGNRCRAVGDAVIGSRQQGKHLLRHRADAACRDLHVTGSTGGRKGSAADTVLAQDRTARKREWGRAARRGGVDLPLPSPTLFSLESPPLHTAL